MIWTASSVLKDFKVKRALNRVCNGTFPDLLRRESSSFLRSKKATMMIDSDQEQILRASKIRDYFLSLQCRGRNAQNLVGLMEATSHGSMLTNAFSVPHQGR